MKVDYQNAEPPAGVLPGEYEVTVCAWDVSTSQNGNQCVVLDYEVRPDIDQECAGQKVRYDNFTFIDSCAWRFSQAAMAAGIPDGYEFNTPEDFGKAMFHRSLVITVEQRTNQNGKKYASVSSFAQSRLQVQQPPLPGTVQPGRQYAAAGNNVQPQQQRQYSQERLNTGGRWAPSQPYAQQAHGQTAQVQKPAAKQQAYGQQDPGGFRNIDYTVNDSELPFN